MKEWGFLWKGQGETRDLKYPLRRQRQMCMSDGKKANPGVIIITKAVATSMKLVSPVSRGMVFAVKLNP